MKRRRDELYKTVIAEIERLGGTVEGERPGAGSHRVIYWSIGQRRFRSTVQQFGGNWRSIPNAIASVRAKAREGEA